MYVVYLKQNKKESLRMSAICIKKTHEMFISKADIKNNCISLHIPDSIPEKHNVRQIRQSLFIVDVSVKVNV